MKMRSWLIHVSLGIVCACACPAQVNSGSDGSDGDFNPTQNVTIDMADHPTGIYNYKSVNVPVGVTVTFKPNVQNMPVVWLVQQDCVIQGTVALDGTSSLNLDGAAGGPGGFPGGKGALGPETGAGAGLGPGGGKPVVTDDPWSWAGNASFGTVGDRLVGQPQPQNNQAEPGALYGNSFLLPLVGGSGGGGGRNNGGGDANKGGGGGGGGALLIAANGEIKVLGNIKANGGNGAQHCGFNCVVGGGGGGSGGALRLVATKVSGAGGLSTSGGTGVGGYSGGFMFNYGGTGRIRIDALTDSFHGPTTGVLTRGFQSIIIPPTNQSFGLAVQSVAGVTVPPDPKGELVTPDVLIPAGQQNPVPILIRCTNIPLNTQVIVEVKPTNGEVERVVGLNNQGSQDSSLASVQLHIPRGGGTIQAQSITYFAGTSTAAPKRTRFDNGWTTSGETFKAVEITATAGRRQSVAYIAESGKRYRAD